jgi:hypothetical protein
VGKYPKSRIVPIALIVVLALVEAGLIAFCQSDIANAWPLGKWPEAQWEINGAAATFWICLGLLVPFIFFMMRKIKLLLFLLCLLIEGWLVWRCVLVPWKHQVVIDKRCFLGISAAFAFCAFLCSLAEMALAKTPRGRVQDWLKYRAENRGKSQGFFAKPREWYFKREENWLRKATRQGSFYNPVITLANTILVVCMALVVKAFLNDSYRDSFSQRIPFLGTISISASDVFTTIGITIVLFVLAELIPKQLASRHPTKALACVLWWVMLTGLFLYIPASTVAIPFEKFMNLIIGPPPID